LVLPVHEAAHGSETPIPEPGDFPLLAHDERALGRELMRGIVQWCKEHAPRACGLDQFKERHGMLGRSCSTETMCDMFHSSPEPNAAAFESWLNSDDKAFRDLARCPNYRVSFAWHVARSVERLAEANADPEREVVYALDETGAIVPPDSFRPEDAILTAGDYEGFPILRSHVTRGPRRYMDAPPWWPKDVAKARYAAKPRHLEHLDFGFGVDLWLEFLPTPAFLAAAGPNAAPKKTTYAHPVECDDELESDEEPEECDDDPGEGLTLF